MNQSDLFPAPVPLVVGYGMGLDSTAMLVEMHNRGIRPDLIQHAHTGGEWPHTYAYRKVIDAWLASVGFPAIVDCRYVPKTAPYSTLEGNCLANETLPSLAFGKHSCSIKFKADPQNRYLRSWLPAVECWASGGRVRKALGYDAGPQDRKRAIRALRYAPPNYDFWYPLQEWGMDREACERVIRAAGLPVPRKSSCYFCPAAKKSEIVQLRDTHPILFRRALKMEAVFLAGKHARKAEHTTTKGRKRRPTVGLGRSFRLERSVERGQGHGRREGACKAMTTDLFPVPTRGAALQPGRDSQPPFGVAGRAGADRSAARASRRVACPAA